MNTSERSMELSRCCLVYSTLWSKWKMYSTLQIVSSVTVFIFGILISTTSAGDCWSARSHGFNTCKRLLKQNMTKDECCKYNGEGISWTEESYSYSDIFKLTNLQNGVPNCQACRDSCEQIDCGPDKRCVMKGGKPRCVCSPSCSKTDVPRGVVCATDGRSYRNLCSMLKERCRTGSLVAMAYYGTCKKSCEGVVCPVDKRCVEDQSRQPHCISCDSFCPQVVEEAFVCGDDGVSYESLCQLKRTECIQDRIIDYQEGRCDNLTSCANVSCVDKKACVLDQGEPECIKCDFLCSGDGWQSKVPICASDGVTYNNWCDLRQHICNTGEYIEIDGLGICGDGELYPAPEEGSGFTQDDNSDAFFNRFLGSNVPIGMFEGEDFDDINATLTNDYETEQNVTDTPLDAVALDGEIVDEGDETEISDQVKEATARFQQHLRNNQNDRNRRGTGN